jgi:sigma-B regulation protein RsbU (phosphoserine phosphatase)
LGEIETTILKFANRDGTDVEGLAKHVLDLTSTEVGSEAASVLFTHLNGQDLYFAAARGPKSEKLVGLRIPADKGIVGFCVGEGVCLGVSDVQKDARFFGRVSKSIGFDTRNILCAPVMAEGQIFGAIELINKEAGSFNKNDLSLLSFVGFQLAVQLKRLFR